MRFFFELATNNNFSLTFKQYQVRGKNYTGNGQNDMKLLIAFIIHEVFNKFKQLKFLQLNKVWTK